MNISVVIPAYNAAASLRAAIESCLQQTRVPNEIIVVDDASDDNTAAIAREYKEVSVISLAKNSGPSAARNRGWNLAKGDIIAFLDSDDTWLNNKLSVIEQLFHIHKDIVYLGHPYIIDHNPAVPGNEHHVATKSYLSILLKNPFQPSCIAVHKTLKERFDESYRYCEDHELSTRVADKYICHWTDTPLTRLGRAQLTSGGASANTWKMRQGELRLYTSIYRHRALYIIFIPFLWVFSFCKMMYRQLFR